MSLCLWCRCSHYDLVWFSQPPRNAKLYDPSLTFKPHTTQEPLWPDTYQSHYLHDPLPPALPPAATPTTLLLTNSRPPQPFPPHASLLGRLWRHGGPAEGPSVGWQARVRGLRPHLHPVRHGDRGCVPQPVRAALRHHEHGGRAAGRGGGPAGNPSLSGSHKGIY